MIKNFRKLRTPDSKNNNFIIHIFAQNLINAYCGTTYHFSPFFKILIFFTIFYALCSILLTFLIFEGFF